ncbi:Uncharacterized protein OBRU01_13877, partial [Operophtera brumata]
TSEPIFPPTLVLYSPGDPEYTDVLVKRVHDNLTLVCELRGDAAPKSYVPYTLEPAGPTTSSKLMKQDLVLSDSGQYLCSAPPFSVTKHILVQTKGPKQCARGAFWCGTRCVLAAYVCDGRRDCLYGEDEAPELCDYNVCARSDKLNCSSGRCISSSACCRGSMPLCRQPACCDEFPITRQLALRGYTHADRATRQHYTMQYAQCVTELPEPRGLARLSSIFSSRYRQLQGADSTGARGDAFAAALSTTT